MERAMKVEALKAFAVEQGVNDTMGRLWDDADYELMLLENNDDLELAKDAVVDSLLWLGWEDDSNGEQVLHDFG